jgi:hypothetical protein
MPRPLSLRCIKRSSHNRCLAASRQEYEPAHCSQHRYVGRRLTASWFISATDPQAHEGYAERAVRAGLQALSGNPWETCSGTLLDKQLI